MSSQTLGCKIKVSQLYSWKCTITIAPTDHEVKPAKIFNKTKRYVTGTCVRKWYIPSHITLPKTFASYQVFAKYNEPIQAPSNSSSSRCGSPIFSKSRCGYKWSRTSPLGVRRVHLYKARSPQELIFVYVTSADPYTSETMPTHVPCFQKSKSSSTASCPSAAP